MSRNDWFLQCQADFIGGPVQRAKQSESTALGAAFLAGIGAGIVPDEATLKKLLSDSTRFDPKMDAATRQQKRARWRKAVEATIRFGESGS
jgi:glycerol kinase